MFKVLRYKRILYCGPLLGVTVEEDDLIKYKKARGLYIEDPWERVKIIFSKDDHGDLHPELIYAWQMFKVGAITGFLYGGMINDIKKAQDYLHSNDLNIFENRKEAMKVFINYRTLAFLTGGLKKAIPFGLFSFSFVIISSCCEAYYNRPQIKDSSIAGIVAGSFSRFFFGIKGMISGGVVGGALGTFYGAFLWVNSKLTNTSQVELKYSHFALAHYRKQLLDRGKETSNEEKDLHSDKDLKH